MKELANLKDLNTGELIAARRRLKNTYIGLGIPISITCLALFYLAFKNNNYRLVVMAMLCLATLLPGLSRLKAIDNEIKIRIQNRPSGNN